METISEWQAFILGVVEGVTEFLPISSTGHLILTSDLIGLRNLEHLSAEQLAAVQAFEIVIQGGAILAVLFLYYPQFLRMFSGLMGKSAAGLKLSVNIVCATLPILLAGFVLKGFISTYLQFTFPVAIALVVGGIAMILFERSFWGKNSSIGSISLDQLSWRQALSIGFLQCLALWPGTSRSMVTIVGGMFFKLPRTSAAEFSFLIGMPALLAATAYKALKDGDLLIEHVGISSLLIGLATSTVCAIFAIKWLVAFLNKRGLFAFGWYRIALGGVLILFYM